jgi:RimJ/RimL family protein N-acetyltransferase
MADEPIRTPRLLLRRMTPGDAPALARLLGRDADPLRVLPHMAAPGDEAAAAEWIARRDRQGARLYAVIHLPFETFLGFAGFGGSSHIPLLGLWIGRPYRRNGFGREVLRAVIDHVERLGAMHIQAELFPEDAASRALLESLDFKLLGVEARGQGGGAPAREVAQYLRDLPQFPLR